MENKPDVFYIIFVKHPLLVVRSIQEAFQEFNVEMSTPTIRVVEIRKSRRGELRLARIIEFENPPPGLINTLEKISGIIITDQTKISTI